MRWILAILLIFNQAFGSITVGKRFVASPIGNSSIKRASLRQPVVTAFRFWLARNEAPGDAASLQATHQAYRKSGGSMKALVTALLTSESFLYRVPAKQPAISSLPR